MWFWPSAKNSFGYLFESNPTVKQKCEILKWISSLLMITELSLSNKHIHFVRIVEECPTDRIMVEYHLLFFEVIHQASTHKYHQTVTFIFQYLEIYFTWSLWAYGICWIIVSVSECRRLAASEIINETDVCCFYMIKTP